MASSRLDDGADNGNAAPMLNLARNALGKVLLFADRVTSPTSLTRDPAAQAKVNAACQDLVLYDLEGCPFCIKVRREMKRLALPIARRDIGKNAVFKQELMAGGGTYQAPCLRITEGARTNGGATRWMYESDEINAYLKSRFSP
mgnify:CR=1 FL=1